jgi:anthranilate phosphoribosyltransferase
MSSLRAPFLPFRNFVHLSENEAYELMHSILSGEMTTAQIAGLLQFLRRKGETVAELVGFARAMQERSEPIDIDQHDAPVLDTCGTGADGAGTFNISTATAFVVAGAGVRVAKHGNRKISSQCGSWDVLESLGIPVNLTAAQVASCVRDIGIGFLYAPALHPAMRHAGEARQMLQGRTIFNLLGPLTNPVRARVQLIGAYSVRAAELLAQAATRLGIERAFVVHGGDGLDEITITAPTTVFQVEDGSVQKGRWTPSDFNVSPANFEDLQGGDPATNAELIQALLSGEPGPRRDIVIANAAAALFLARHSVDLKSAIAAAAQSIDSGAALAKLESLCVYASSLSHEGL